MKKSYLTCGGMALVMIVILVIAIIFGIKAFQSTFRESLLNELGFTSEQEYKDFVNVMNEPFDATTFYSNTYSSSDIEYVKNALTTNIVLEDGSPLFLESGYLNIEAIDKEGNTSVIGQLCFTEQQFAYFENFLYSSLFASETNANILSNMSILSFKLNTTTNHTVILKLKTAKLKETLGDFSEALPDDLYITLNYDIIYDEKWQTTNQSIKFNTLDDTYNEKCIKFFNGCMQAHPAVKFSNIFITLINSFNTTANTTTNFSDSQITIEGGV